MTAQEKLSEPKFAELVTSAIEAYENNGGPYLGAVHRHQAEKLGYNKEEVGQLWLDAMGRVKLAGGEKSNLARAEAKQVEAKVEPKVEGPSYRRIVPTAGTLYLPLKKTPNAEIAERAERQIKPI